MKLCIYAETYNSRSPRARKLEPQCQTKKNVTYDYGLRALNWSPRLRYTDMLHERTGINREFQNVNCTANAATR